MVIIMLQNNTLPSSGSFSRHAIILADELDVQAACCHRRNPTLKCVFLFFMGDDLEKLHTYQYRLLEKDGRNTTKNLPVVRALHAYGYVTMFIAFRGVTTTDMTTPPRPVAV